MKKLLLLLLLLLSAMALAQSVQVKQFPGTTLGEKLANAQTFGCAPDTNVNCLLEIAPEMNVFSEGTLPTKCSRCFWFDKRNGGGFTSFGSSNRDCSKGYPGSTAAQKINACITDVIAQGGGEADARAFTGSQTIDQEIDVGQTGANPAAVKLLLPVQGIWTITITDGVSCGIKVFHRSMLVGSSAGLSQLRIRPSASVSADSAVCTEPTPTNGGSNLRMEGFGIDNPNGGVFSNGALHIQKVFDNSLFANIAVFDWTNDQIVVYGACCGTTFLNVTANANGTGKRGVWVKADASARNSDIAFYSLSATHPGNGFAAVEVSGGAAAPTDTVNNDICFYTLYTEDLQNVNPTQMLKVVDARDVCVYGFMVNNGSGSPNASFVGLDISQTGANQVRNVNVYDYKYQSPGGAVAISNHISGQTFGISTTYFSRYSYGGSTGSQVSQPSIFEDNEFDFRDAAGNFSGQITPTGSFIGKVLVATRGSVCTNGELALGAGWGTTATVTTVVGTGQTCEWTLTSSGTGQAANPTITDTLTNTLPTATVACDMRMVGGTGVVTLIDQTTLSATIPVFTFLGTPVAASTYKVVRRCGP